MIPLTPVESSSMDAIGYDPLSKVLSVRFKGKNPHAQKVHQYKDVEPEKHAALMAADSIGTHFAKHIKPHHAHTPLVP